VVNETGFGSKQFKLLLNRTDFLIDMNRQYDNPIYSLTATLNSICGLDKGSYLSNSDFSIYMDRFSKLIR